MCVYEFFEALPSLFDSKRTMCIAHSTLDAGVHETCGTDPRRCSSSMDIGIFSPQSAPRFEANETRLGLTQINSKRGFRSYFTWNRHYLWFSAIDPNNEVDAR